ncbi:MAG: DUF4843 domain-containing protein [Odoribacteraceae bacterium]|jgi:hypothetical protein|nr:DUF4843 domain-containing protein [Odoribacteraceae bacterium]
MKKYLIFLLGVLLVNCSEDTLPLYNGVESIYFDKTGEINFSFGLLAVNDSTISIPVTATGPIVDRDRRFRVLYDSVSGQEGLHFDPLPDEGIFPAGSSKGYIPIRLHRVNGDNDIYQIHLRLVPSDDFSLDLTEKYSGSDTIDLTRVILNYSSSITKPNGWQDMIYGYFSVAKYLLASELTGRDETFWRANASQTSIALSPVITIYINSKILAGRDQALRDPGNTDPADKGFMTMRGINSYYGQYVKIPDDWAPANE